MNSQKLRIGIATDSTKIIGLLYEHLTQNTPVFNSRDHIDIVMYSTARSGGVLVQNPLAGLYEKSRVLAKMEVDIALLPDIDVAGLGEDSALRIYNEVPIVKNSPHLGLLHADSSEKDVAKWSDFIRDKVFSGVEGVDLLQKTALPHRALQQSVDGLVKGNVIALHGGIAPESTIDPILYLAERHPEQPVLVASEATTPDPSWRLRHFDVSGYSGKNTFEDPFERLSKTHRLLAQFDPVAEIMVCNTAHHWYEKMMLGDEAGRVHLIDNAIEHLPPNAKALLLATKATIDQGLYSQAIERTGRTDIELILPDAQQQKQVQQAIFNKVMTGKIKEGGEIFAKVIDHYQNKLGDEGCVIAGCTDVSPGLRALNDPKIDEMLVDPVRLGCDSCVEIAQSAQKSRFVV